MKSRMEKYYTEKPSYNRTTRNAGLYKEVYKNYADLENLPIADNTNEIDIKELKEIVRTTNKRPTRPVEISNERELTARRQEEQREYDINKILEKAKSTNRSKEATKKNISPNYKYLTTLESQELSIPEIKKAYKEYEENKISETPSIEIQEQKEEIYMTRELKFHEKQLEVTKEIKLMEQEESSPLDLFEDLKPNGNSFIVEPVKPDKNSIFASMSEKEDDEDINPKIEEIEKNIKEEIGLNNEDVDIIKKEQLNAKETIDNDFYTSSYKFSKRDFIDEDDDFYDSPKKGSGILKVILLLLAIFALTAIIYFFISKYGMGI